MITVTPAERHRTDAAAMSPRIRRSWRHACAFALLLGSAVAGDALAREIDPDTGLPAAPSPSLPPLFDPDTTVAVGGTALASANMSVAVGAQAHARATGSVAIGYASLADRANTVSVGRAGAERQIVHVAAGTADTDAVNMAQMRAAGLFDGHGNALDAATYDIGSQRGLLTFAGEHGTRLRNVMDGLIAPGSRDAVNGGQLWALQERVDSLDRRVTNLESPPRTKPAILQPDDPGDATGTVTGTTEDDTGESGAANLPVEGQAGDDPKIPASTDDRAPTPTVTGVVPAADAVRPDQLRDAVSDVKSWANEKFDGLSRKIDANQRQANRGIAASAALIDNMPYLPGKTTLNTGFATYRGQSAFGVGVSRWSENGRINVNAGISAAAGDRPIFRVGLGLVLGD